MRIIFELHHPKHYYQVKYIYKHFDNHLFVIKSKDILEELLISEGVEYVKIGNVKTGIFKKLLNSFGLVRSLSKTIRTFKPDIIFSKASPYSVLLSPFYNFKSIITPDSEVVALTNRFISKLADKIITQHCFELDFGNKHSKLETFFESCYLHPDYFIPNFNQLNKYGFRYDEKIILIRFINWEANHDIGKSGLNDQQKIKLVAELENFGRVIISSEKELPAKLEEKKFIAPPNIMHQLLYHASLYFGDSQSMATEAALLGTPSIRCNSFVGPNDMSNFIYLEKQLNMLYNFNDLEQAASKAFEILADSGSKKRCQMKRVHYFKSIKDPNKQLLSLIHSYTNE